MALARWQATIVDEAGDIQPLASVEVRREVPGQPLVALFSDRDGLVSIGNPFLADANGFAFFHAVGGSYQVTASLGGLELVPPWRYVALGTAAEIDAEAVSGVAGATGSVTGDGVTTVFDIGVLIGSAASLQWVEDGIQQQPGVDFTVDGTEVTRATAPAEGAAIFWVLFGAAGEVQDLGLKVDKAGDVMTGPLTLSGNAVNALHAVPKQQHDAGLALKAPIDAPTFTTSVTLPGDPSAALQAATKQYVDGLLANVGKRARVRAATTANITIATALNNGDTLDTSVTLVTGDLVLVKNQTAPAENGVYVVGVTPARDAQFDTYNEHPGSLIAVEEGTVNADTLWLCTSNDGGTLDTTAIAFSKMVVAGELLTADIGVSVQAYSAKTAAIAALTWAADKLLYFSDAATPVTATLSSVARTMLAQATQALMRTTGLGSTTVGDAIFIAADAAAARTAAVAAKSGENSDIDRFLALAEAAAPSTPAANKVALYAKADGLLYSKDDAGVETTLGAAGSSYAGVDAPRIQTISNSAVTTVDLANTDTVYFSSAGAGTLSSFTNAIAGKRYVFRNAGAGTWTIDRSNAYLPGSANAVLLTRSQIMLAGVNSTTMEGVSPVAING